MLMVYNENCCHLCRPGMRIALVVPHRPYPVLDPVIPTPEEDEVTDLETGRHLTQKERATLLHSHCMRFVVPVSKQTRRLFKDVYHIPYKPLM